jgi:hypothetical protein
MPQETQNPIAEAEQTDNYFDTDEEDTLYDAYCILFQYGYSHDDLDPLRHLIAQTTNYDGYSLVRGAERDVSDDE